MSFFEYFFVVMVVMVERVVMGCQRLSRRAGLTTSDNLTTPDIHRSES